MGKKVSPLGTGAYASKQEIADHLGVNKRTIERLLHRGELPMPIRIGRQLRWRTENLLKFLEEREAAAAR